MRDSRRGETLWFEWTGELYVRERKKSVVFFTWDHVDLEHDVIKRALASVLQREGIVNTLGEGYRTVESSKTHWRYAGMTDDSEDLVICNDEGETFLGDHVPTWAPVTIVEV